MILRVVILLVSCIVFSSVGYGAPVVPTEGISSVLKLKTYERNPVDGSFMYTQYGSAVIIDGKKIITNAHVILDKNGNKPTGYYEVCYTEKNKKLPTCFGTAKLLSYDKIVDLAVLEITSLPKTMKSVTMNHGDDVTIGKNVIVYGYPAIGGFTITRTEGKIGGFDNENYKFDGTIDHGNSGGGAFDTNGKFIGIPYAVSSDNGVIGYIIPVSKIDEFLAKKTDSIEKFTTKIHASFSSYIRSIEAVFARPNAIKTKYIDLKNAEKNGFSLASAVSSIDGSVFTYKFFDKNERVFLTIGCAKEAQSTWKNSIERQKASLQLLKDNKDNAANATEIEESNGTIHVTYILDKKETKGQRYGMKIVLYKNAPTCSALVIGTDPEKKDKTSFEKAYQLAKNVKFLQPQSYASRFESAYFTAPKIPENIFVGEYAQYLGGNDVLPNISLLSIKGKESISSEYDLLEFENVGEYLEYSDYGGKSYSESSYSFQDFFDIYKTVGSQYTTDTIITTKNGKKLIMTVSNYSDTDVFPAKYEKYVRFFYPFVTETGEYRAYKFTFILHTSEDADMYILRDFMESLELPGKSPFTNE